MPELPKIVSQRLHAAEIVRAHPDPDLVTAFLENSLRSRERIQVLEHLSRCTGCRELVSLAMATPDSADADVVSVSSAGWLSWPVLRWGAAVACVIVVGAALTLHHKPEFHQITPPIAKRNSAAEPQIEASKTTFVNQVPPVQSPDHGTETAIVTSQADQPSAASLSRPPTVAGGATVPAAPSANAAAPPSPVEMADARTGSPLPEVPGRAKVAIAESQDAHQEKAAGALMKQRSMALTTEASSVATDALTPSSLAPRWTLSSDGTLQRSVDSGRTWQTIRVSNNTIFRALAANGLDIWVGGSAGALFHSSDAGQHWTQLRPVANGDALSDDIIGVEFTDIQHGKLTTSGGEIWMTADAGQSWKKQ